MRRVAWIVFLCCGLLILGCLGRQAGKAAMTEEERLFRANCRACHVLPEPSELGDEQWLEFLSSHPDRVDLPDEDRAAILKHLQDSN